jgi:hypothetical protein
MASRYLDKFRSFVKAATLDEAADNVPRAAATTGLLKPIRLLVQTTADFTAETEHPHR